MNTVAFWIEKTIKLYEINTGWGDSDEWTNQDFVRLSEKIQERTGEALSHVTLKRVWGKVKYESLPNTHTLNTLVQYLGYENWRTFKMQNGNVTASANTAGQINSNSHVLKIIDNKPELQKKTWVLKSIWFIAIPIELLLKKTWVLKSIWFIAVPIMLLILIVFIVSMHGL